MHDSNGIVGLKPGEHTAALPSHLRLLCLSACLGLLLLALPGCGQKGPLYLPSATEAGTPT
ncbi:LPS translocon maturation chaperone LptM [Serpentinimonas maccroryi]|uniref:LPS translocon maturation chaperone LptM n=1 Tax=Serpentinimonas maccroryi TaxID=1458426 RepID=UPI001186F782